MDTFRRRFPFINSDDDLGAEEETHILDEQEQEEIVQSLRHANTASSRRYGIFLRVIISLSIILQLTSILDSSHGNPLLAIFPSTVQDPVPSIPLPSIFALLSVSLHANIYLLAFPDDMKTTLRLQVVNVDIRPLSYPVCYAVAAVAPVLSLFLRRAWQSTVWWSITVVIIFIVQNVTEAVADGNESISRLETMKYVAHGA